MTSQLVITGGDGDLRFLKEFVEHMGRLSVLATETPATLLDKSKWTGADSETPMAPVELHPGVALLRALHDDMSNTEQRPNGVDPFEASDRIGTIIATLRGDTPGIPPAVEAPAVEAPAVEAPALTEAQREALMLWLPIVTDLAWERRDNYTEKSEAQEEAAGTLALCDLLAASPDPAQAAEGRRLQAVMRNLIEVNESEYNNK